MAVLTYDKRGIGSDDWYEPGLETLAADAAAALRAGRSMPEIDPGRAGSWASSQGGWLAGHSISRADEIAAPYVGEAWYRAAFGEGAISALWSDRWWSWVGENFAISPMGRTRRWW